MAKIRRLQRKGVTELRFYPPGYGIGVDKKK